MPQDEKTKAAFERIEQGVKDVYSSESFKQYLSCLSKFHSYSLNKHFTNSFSKTRSNLGSWLSFLAKQFQSSCQ